VIEPRRFISDEVWADTGREDGVIARAWRGWTKAEDADAYEAHLRPELLPGVSKMPGFAGSYLLRRVVGDEVEFMTILLWESMEGIRTLTGKDYQRAVIPEERKKYLVRFEEKAAHFDVVASVKKD
jgi:heme-degrading monooxygenase HmoA